MTRGRTAGSTGGDSQYSRPINAPTTLTSPVRTNRRSERRLLPGEGGPSAFHTGNGAEGDAVADGETASSTTFATSMLGTEGAVGRAGACGTAETCGTAGFGNAPPSFGNSTLM